MAIPNVAIVGRPNVGKSSLFNWLTGRRVAIVDPTAGVTRDRVSQLIEEQDRYFELTDTGGMGITDSDGLTEDVERQIRHAVAEAELILFVVDAHDGVAPLDELVLERLRAEGKQILLVANKCDNPRWQTQATGEFARFGLPPILVSVSAGMGKDELLGAVVAALPPCEERVAEPTMKLAIVGKTNVGKSTFINFLADEERMIVSEVPGTTRDSVDVRFEHQGRSFVAIDTAGVRKNAQWKDNVAYYSHLRAKETIRRADVVLLFFDAGTEIGRIEKQLSRAIVENFKPCVLVVNKWDLMREKKVTTGEFNEYLDSVFRDLTYAPRAFVTAKTGKNAWKLVELAESLFKQASERVPTARLNKVFQEAMAKAAPKAKKGRHGRIFYASQIEVRPPTLVAFCNDPDLFDTSYQRFLLNFCRERLPFGEVPIRLILRSRETKPIAGEAGAETR